MTNWSYIEWAVFLVGMLWLLSITCGIRIFLSNATPFQIGHLVMGVLLVVFLAATAITGISPYHLIWAYPLTFLAGIFVPTTRLKSLFWWPCVVLSKIMQVGLRVDCPNPDCSFKHKLYAEPDYCPDCDRPLALTGVHSITVPDRNKTYTVNVVGYQVELIQDECGEFHRPTLGTRVALHAIGGYRAIAAEWDDNDDDDISHGIVVILQNRIGDDLVEGSIDRFSLSRASGEREHWEALAEIRIRR